jgi:hypothetical protein
MNKAETTISRTASCGCGRLTATAQGEPIDIYLCSCRDCQRLSGSSYSYGAIYPPDAVTIAGERKVWRHYGDSGRWIDNHFCSTCGNTVYTTGEIGPEIGISVGCFAEANFPPPKRMYWASRRHHWLKLPEETEIMDTQPESVPYS